jgi:hypothetical protein
MLRVLAAITVLLALPAPQTAAAKTKPRPHQVANNVAWYAVDGSRYAAWGKEPADSFTVLDTRTHKRRTRSKPIACSNRGDGRSMLDGWMLMNCEGLTAYDQRLLNLRTGSIHQLPVGEASWVALGKRWIEGITAEHGTRDYLNRRTGQIRRFSTPSDPNADPPVRNLDDPKLRVVCVDPGWLTNRARFYDGKYLVSEPDGFPYRFMLHRSCDARGRFLTGAGGDATPPFVDAGWITWGKGGGAHALNLATSKRYSWHVPHYRDVGTPEVAQTNNTLFFAPPQTDDGTSAPAITSYDLFTTPLLGAK